MADLPPYPGTPRWVKAIGITALVLVLLAVLAMLTGLGGPHGPGRHMPGNEAANAILLSFVAWWRSSSGQGPDDCPFDGAGR